MENKEAIEIIKSNLPYGNSYSMLQEALNLAIKCLSNENTINNFCKEVYQIAKSKGWHDEGKEMGTILALIHSEVSEALEADRKGNYDNFCEELADICLRVFDLCGSMGIDLEEAIIKKMEYNKGRSYKHGGKKY